MVNTIFMKNKNQGVVLLYAVLMVSIVLTVSLSLLNITFKQIILSATNRDSKIAYYAADSALQCAFYWDLYAKDPSGSKICPFGYFDLATGNFISQTDPIKQKVTCFNQPEKTLTVEVNGSLIISTFDIDIPFDVTSKGYAKVEVTKGKNPDGTAMDQIVINGYNTSDSNSPRRVERTLVAK